MALPPGEPSAATKRPCAVQHDHRRHRRARPLAAAPGALAAGRPAGVHGREGEVGELVVEEEAARPSGPCRRCSPPWWSSRPRCPSPSTMTKWEVPRAPGCASAPTAGAPLGRPGAGGGPARRADQLGAGVEVGRVEQAAQRHGDEGGVGEIGSRSAYISRLASANRYQACGSSGPRLAMSVRSRMPRPSSSAGAAGRRGRRRRRCRRGRAGRPPSPFCGLVGRRGPAGSASRAAALRAPWRRSPAAIGPSCSARGPSAASRRRVAA